MFTNTTMLKMKGEGLASEAVAVGLLTEAVPVVDNCDVEVHGGIDLEGKGLVAVNSCFVAEAVTDLLP